MNWVRPVSSSYQCSELGKCSKRGCNNKKISKHRTAPIGGTVTNLVFAWKMCYRTIKFPPGCGDTSNIIIIKEKWERHRGQWSDSDFIKATKLQISVMTTADITACFHSQHIWQWEMWKSIPQSPLTPHSYCSQRKWAHSTSLSRRRGRDGDRKYASHANQWFLKDLTAMMFTLFH